MPPDGLSLSRGEGPDQALGRALALPPGPRGPRRQRRRPRWFTAALLIQSEPFMAEMTTSAVEASSIPDPALIERAEAFTRERFVHEGEVAAVALAPGTGRRRALDAALAELDKGAKVPSTKWRRRYALLLGLERVLSDDEPKLADGTLLNPHQVDALSGTLVALLASAQARANGNGAAPAAVSPPVLAVDEEPEVEDDDEDVEVVDVDVDEDEDDNDDAAEVE